MFENKKHEEKHKQISYVGWLYLEIYKVIVDGSIQRTISRIKRSLIMPLFLSSVLVFPLGLITMMLNFYSGLLMCIVSAFVFTYTLYWSSVHDKK